MHCCFTKLFDILIFVCFKIFTFSNYALLVAVYSQHCFFFLVLCINWFINDDHLVYTTQVKSTFRACWLASSEVINQVLFTSEQLKKNKMASRFASVSKCQKWNYSLIRWLFSLCGPVYTKTIIHLSVSESGEYLPLFTSTSVNNC